MGTCCADGARHDAACAICFLCSFDLSCVRFLISIACDSIYLSSVIPPLSVLITVPFILYAIPFIYPTCCPVYVPCLITFIYATCYLHYLSIVLFNFSPWLSPLCLVCSPLSLCDMLKLCLPSDLTSRLSYCC